ncbi:MAG: hypothetical protein IJ598_07265 [Ruminococcus sp.]|nr:hypothetical protein [Ruminococcus sp.]
MFDDFLNYLGGDNSDDDFSNGVDLDGDGIVDAMPFEVDMDGDGVADGIGLDFDGDGSIDYLGMDTDGDGTIDEFEDLTNTAADDMSTSMDYTGVDLDGDGVIDAMGHEVDLDGDGVFDGIGMDTNGDGVDDMVQVSHWEDTDGDGVEDALVTETYMDSNANGVFDTMMTETYMDTNGSGRFDTVFRETKIDSDENGVFDHFVTENMADTDEDGVFDAMHIEYAEDIGEDGELDYVFSGTDYGMDGQLDEVSEFGTPGDFPMEHGTGEAENYHSFDPDSANPNSVVGEPTADAAHWHVQETGSTCAVASQEFVLEELTGREYNEHELAQIAEAHGWYTPGDETGGTPLNCVGNLLDYMGLNTERSTGNGIQDIENTLAHGGKVIVGVDADELWSGETDDFFGPGMDADHAIEVIGINHSDPDHPTVIVNDSGVANGCAAEMPLEDFLEAWEDSDCFMVEAYA